ncbi:MAG TPA: hypothetical protein VM513_35335 [Kofleriaceae bacterium]|jgi:hypothetical protein|nr:hypothetical protein [Kofleriaceae bacterium]
MTWIGLASLMLVVFTTTNHGEALATDRGDTPAPAHERLQHHSSCAAIVAFTQVADDPADEELVLDIALDVAGWHWVITRTSERVHRDEPSTRTTQVVSRARPARGPPV